MIFKLAEEGTPPSPLGLNSCPVFQVKVSNADYDDLDGIGFRIEPGDTFAWISMHALNYHAIPRNTIQYHAIQGNVTK